MSNVGELNARKQMILQALVFEYIIGAEPVGSELITTKYPMGVRSATIRNELAEMSELGYLEQPHTSAGRIPSDLGYRYYVDNILILNGPEPADKNCVRTSTSHGDTLHAILQETTSMVSRLTRLMSAASLMSTARHRAKAAIISALGPDRALLVLLLSNGHVENRYLHVPCAITLEDVGFSNEQLATLTEGKSLTALQRLRHEPTGRAGADALIAAALQSIRAISKDLAKGRVFIDGEEHILSQPEFLREHTPVLELLSSIEDADVAQRVFGTEGSTSPVSIGRENEVEMLRPFTIIRRTFRVGDEEAGTIAVVGPTRLNYDRAIPIIDFAAEAISHTLTQLIGD